MIFLFLFNLILITFIKICEIIIKYFFNFVMAKLKATFFLVFICFVLFISCNSKIQNITKDKCSLSIKSLNQTVFNSAI
jgi:hypothetical protein